MNGRRLAIVCLACCGLFWSGCSKRSDDPEPKSPSPPPVDFHAPAAQPSSSTATAHSPGWFPPVQGSPLIWSQFEVQYVKVVFSGGRRRVIIDGEVTDRLTGDILDVESGMRRFSLDGDQDYTPAVVMRVIKGHEDPSNPEIVKFRSKVD